MRTFQISVIWGLSMSVLILLGGCHSAHQRNHIDSIKDDIEGRWVGKWHCEQTGDSGKLRCHLTKQEDGRYQARFDGTYWGFLPFWYTIQMDISERDTIYYVQAKENLGWLGGGIYTYEGIINNTEFQISYTSIRHKGTFVLERYEQK